MLLLVMDVESEVRALDQMEGPPGLDFAMSPLDFERATTTISCLRQFLVDCASAIQASSQEGRLYLTPGDGRPRRSGGWAWHGLSVPFTFEGQKGRVGIYKYSEAPLGETGALGELWLEAFFSDSDEPVVATVFAPVNLGSENLAERRGHFVKEWNARRSS